MPRGRPRKNPATSPKPIPEPLVIGEGLLRLGVVHPSPDASNFLGVSPDKVYRLMRSGQLPFVRIGPTGERRIPKVALIEFLERHLVVREEQTA